MSSEDKDIYDYAGEMLFDSMTPAAKAESLDQALLAAKHMGIDKAGPKPVWTVNQLVVHDTSLPAGAVRFSNPAPVAYISPEGIMSFTVVATDENALAFIELMERVFERRLTGLNVTKVQPNE